MRLEHRRNVNGVESSVARAELTDAGESRPAKGRCAFREPAGTDGTWRDVGETITLSRDGADPIVLERATLGSLVVYGADGLPASDSPAGATLDVTLSGNEDVAARMWSNAIEIPEAIEPGELLNQIGFGVEQPFSWTPSGVEEVLVEVSSGAGPDLVCRAKGSAGEIVVPQSQNEQLSAAGGTVTYRSVERKSVSLDGDSVSLEGHSVVVLPYQ